ncbi:MAG: acyl-CoA thioesterase [Actinomycetota bacterium]|nr:acyl-CoA thioesterase [Actinomycetota bacterium]
MTRHGFQQHVRWSDVDSYGHVNNVKYFEYVQEARLAFLQSLAADVTPTGAETFVVARQDVDYLRPMRFRSEPFTIESWVTRVGTSSYELEAEIKDGDAVLARARTVVVAFDARTQRSRPLRADERSALQRHCDGTRA